MTLSVIARNNCKFCFGTGYTCVKQLPCTCALRKVFDICYEYYLYSSNFPRNFAMVEFVVDFTLVSVHKLRRDKEDLKIFTLHYLKSIPGEICAAKLKMSLKYFFRRCDAIREKLGRTFVKLKPYSLFPINDYTTLRHI